MKAGEGWVAFRVDREYFNEVEAGRKTAEVRFLDRSEVAALRKADPVIVYLEDIETQTELSFAVRSVYLCGEVIGKTLALICLGDRIRPGVR